MFLECRTFRGGVSGPARPWSVSVCAVDNRAAGRLAPFTLSKDEISELPMSPKQLGHNGLDVNARAVHLREIRILRIEHESEIGSGEDNRIQPFALD